MQAGNVRLTAEVAALCDAAYKKDAEFRERLSQFMAELTADAENVLEENRSLKEENLGLKEELESSRQRPEKGPESAQKRMEKLQDGQRVNNGASDEQLEAIRKELSDRAAECEVLKQWLQKDRDQKTSLEEKVRSF